MSSATRAKIADYDVVDFWEVMSSVLVQFFHVVAQLLGVATLMYSPVELAGLGLLSETLQAITDLSSPELIAICRAGRVEFCARSVKTHL